jgi:sugar lactone lactonase YvrE
MNNPARLIPILRYALLALGLIAGPAVALAQTAPTVTTHPSSATVTLPTAATAAFSVVVSGDPAPGLQWQVNAGPGWVTLFNDANYSGVTTASLSVAGVTTAMNGYQYRAVATNASGTVNSNPATLTVQSVPAFTSAATTSFTLNAAGTFTVAASGFPAPTISLLSGSLPTGVALTTTSTGTDSTTATLAGTPTSGGGSTISLVLRAGNAAANTDQTFSLVVMTVPAITTQPASATPALGERVTLTAAASGSPTPTFLWQRLPSGSATWVDLSNDGTFSGATSATLVIGRMTSGLAGDSFRVVATNAAGSATSNQATLTLGNSTVISTFAGGAGEPGSIDATATAARFNAPSGIALDSAGNLYVADVSNHVVRKVTAAGVVTTLAGASGAIGSADGASGTARFSGPTSVAVSPTGVVYVADTYNHTIRVISPDGTTSTLAGSPGVGGNSDGSGSTARFLYPSGIAYSPLGYLLVSDTFNHSIKRVNLNGLVTTVAGSTAGQQGSLNGFGTASRFSYPYGIAIDALGVAYIADSANHTIRKMDLTTTVSTLAGTAGSSGATDATGASARFNQPSAVAVDAGGSLFVADTQNNTLRKVTPAGVVTTLAGTAGSAGSADGVIAAARFRQPLGVAVDSAGVIYIADTRNHTIRRTSSGQAPYITTQPQAAAAVIGGAATFRVAAAGVPGPSYFTWMRQAAGTSGFSVLAADSTYSGVDTATLTVSNVTAAMSGDLFVAVVSNLVGANVTSLSAALTTGTAPVFTSEASATFRATVAGSFTVAATASPTPSFSATGLPSWASLDSTSGVLSGTAPDNVGSPFTITLTASNGIVTNQTFTLTVLPAILPPTIATAPSATTVNQGQNATLSVSVTGTEPFTYQWRRNGVAIEGATAASLLLSAVQPAAAGNYTVTVTNSSGSVTSSAAALSVNTAPVLTQQPRSVAVLAGSPVTLSVTASGSNSFTYQWRKYGVAVAGATNASLTLSGSASDAGNYDVQVGNALGTATSAVAQVTVVSAASAPVITLQPAARSAVAGGAVSMEVGAIGVPAPSVQWRKNGVAVPGATTGILSIAAAQAADAGSYDAVLTNTAGSVTSASAVLRVAARSYAGTYFGTFASGQGTVALLVRDDNSGVLLGFISGSSIPVIGQSFTVNDSGAFSFAQSSGVSLVVAGTIAGDGSVTGTTGGTASVSFSANRAPAGATQTVAGLYKAGAAASGASAFIIAGPDGRAYALVTAGTSADGASGSVTSAGAVSVTTGRNVVTAAINTSTGILTGSVSGTINATLAGGGESALGVQRLVNISTRARVGSGDSVAIAGFVIAGEESKPVLIRAVGPTLGAAPFNVPGVLASPRLELFRGATSLAVNSGVAANRSAIDAAGRQAGAFALDAAGADAAILTTLAPGNYTAQVSGLAGSAGIALIEVYDLSTAAAGQKMLNIATRASAGSGDNTLIAGFVVPAGASKRVLVRAVGPGLAVFGVSGVLAQPVLQLQAGATTVAQNTNWTTSTDRDAISAGSSQAGAFALSAGDSALIATLAPGNYTVLVTGSGGASGIALVEVYELP